MVVAFAFAMSIFGVIFFYIGVSLGWLYVSRGYIYFTYLFKLHFQLFKGTLLGSAVIPIALCTTWSKANKWGCINGAIWGLIAGIIAWIVTTAKLHSNVINIETTGGDYEMLAGNLAAIGVGGIISVVTSYFVSHFSSSFPAVITFLLLLYFFKFTSVQYPEDFNFDATRAINAPVHHDKTKATATANEGGPSSPIKKVPEEKAAEKEVTHSVAVVQIGITRAEELDPVALNKAFKFAARSSVALVRFIHK